MKKGIIAITLLLSGVLFVSPLTTNANSIKNDNNQVKIEEQQNTEKVEVLNKVEKEETEEKSQVNDSQSVETETTIDKKDETIKVDEIVEEEAPKEEEKSEEVVQKDEMTQYEAEVFLNNYLDSIQEGGMTYTYQGDENTFEAIKEKGIRGYVFLPNAETDLAYLVDKDNGNIYYFHPSGYFELV